MKLTRESIIKQLKGIGFDEVSFDHPYWLKRVNYRIDNSGRWEDVCIFRDDVLHYKLVKDACCDPTMVSHVVLDYHKVSSVGFWWGLNSLLEMKSSV